MSHNVSPVFDAIFQKAEGWLRDMMAYTNGDAQTAYQSLRSVLHVLRDRLRVDEAADLGAQLPLLVRGIYYEGWDPSSTPTRIRDRDEFIEAVRDRLDRRQDIAPEKAIEATLRCLSQHVTQGEIDDVRAGLPKTIQSLWPTDVGLQ